MCLHGLMLARRARMTEDEGNADDADERGLERIGIGGLGVAGRRPVVCPQSLSASICVHLWIQSSPRSGEHPVDQGGATHHGPCSTRQLHIEKQPPSARR